MRTTRTRSRIAGSALRGLLVSLPRLAAGDPLDAEGWTILQPGPETRRVYVCRSLGDDGNAGDAPERPKRSIAAGKAALRNGRPDWLLLKAGDTWEEPLGVWDRSGRSEREPLVVAPYGDGPRPVLKTGGRDGLSKLKGAHRHLRFVGLDIVNDRREPDAPGFDAAQDAGAGFRWLRDGRDILIEDCRFRFFTMNIILDRYTGAALQDVRIRRCAVTDAYAVASHSQGLYAAHVDGLVLEQNGFDHNGWSERVPAGRATMFNHNAYLTECTRVVLRGNAFLRASSMGIKFRSDAPGAFAGVAVENNLFVEGEIGISIGGNQAGASRFRDVVIRDNVLLHVGRSRPTRRDVAWYLDLQDLDQGSVAGNLLLDQPHLENTYGIRLAGTACRRVSIQENVIYGIRNRGLWLDRAAAENRTPWTEVEIRGNAIQGPPGDGCLVACQGPLDGIRWADNRYYTAGPVWARVDARDLSFDSWVRAARETEARSDRIRFVEPARDIESYQRARGGEPSLAAFAEDVRAQGKARWREACTAAAVNAYLRDGFRPVR